MMQLGGIEIGYRVICVARQSNSDYGRRSWMTVLRGVAVVTQRVIFTREAGRRKSRGIVGRTALWQRDRCVLRRRSNIDCQVGDGDGPRRSPQRSTSTALKCDYDFWRRDGIARDLRRGISRRRAWLDWPWKTTRRIKLRLRHLRPEPSHCDAAGRCRRLVWSITSLDITMHNGALLLLGHDRDFSEGYMRVGLC